MIGAFLPKLIPLLQQAEAQAAQARAQQMAQAAQHAPQATPMSPRPGQNFPPPQPIAAHGQFLPPQPPQMPPGNMPVVPH
jgi:hypothetical protein